VRLNAVYDWIAISDNVIESVTTSALSYADTSMLLTGGISPENNAGFTFVKSLLAVFDL
jgi:hypothetical protein